MAAARKFGTFAGVFVPSILAILGVIMYLRLPAIVGQAGLWTTLGIIVVAHVISLATGLSVASVATDRKVRAGGTYYMLSRSLGLPIGGTLGIALFVGLSFGVSLYVIGFAESFLSFWGVEITKNALRLTGAAALAAVTVVTLVGTALALRLQFLILAAMALSLLSIFLGRHDLAPAGPLLDPLPTAAPFIVLFAIFFPAVTGFEAGVSLSGDLRDPKRAIPRGTLAAIGVGFLVYLLLAVFLAYRVDAGALVGSPRVLLEISRFPPLVAAGIWAATISSAMGAILGAPRILQATSLDRVTPAFFARGHGQENEPRRALFLSAGLALCGVLVGELDVIARIVSIFFIAAYGFLNLSCAIESWASPDFRPAFRIPSGVSIVGAVACLVVMIQLDLLAMIGAAVVLGALYLHLVRRELKLESGDAWEGFWSSVARAALHRLDRDERHQRNWRPNIIVFGGPAGARPQLAELGRQLIDKGGVLSHFDLVESPEGRARAPRPREPVRDERREDLGTFVRRVECADVYTGMEMIARYYGFAGIEPNTVLLGWPRWTREPARAVGLLRTFAALDYNILLLDRDEQRGFGRRRRVDVWWRGEGANAGLALALVRFLSTSDAWRDAAVRFLTVTEEGGALASALHRTLSLRLEEFRVRAEVRVIDNAVVRRPFAEVVRAESADADLAILGLPGAGPREPAAWMRETSALLDSLGSVLLVRASSFFGAEATGVGRGAGLLPAGGVALGGGAEPAGVDDEPPGLVPPAAAALAPPVSRFDEALQRAAGGYADVSLARAYAALVELVHAMGQLAERVVLDFERQAGSDRPRGLKAVRRLQGELLFQARRLLAEYREREVARQAETLAFGSDWLLGRAASVAEAAPVTVMVEAAPDALRPAPGDTLPALLFKLQARARSRVSGQPVRYAVPLRALARRHLEEALPAALEEALRRFSRASALALSDAQRLVARARSALERIEAALAGEDESPAAVLERSRAEVLALAEESLEAQRAAVREARGEVRRALRGAAQAVAAGAERGEGWWWLPAGRLPSAREAAARAARLAALPEAWTASTALLLNEAELEILLFALQNRLRAIARRELGALRLAIQNGTLARLRQVSAALAEFRAAAERDPPADFPRRFEAWPELRGDDFVDRLVAELRAASAELPEQVETVGAESMGWIEAGVVEEVEAITISLRPLVDYRLDTEFVGPLQALLVEAGGAIDRAVDAARDAVRLTAFRIAGPDALTTPDGLVPGGRAELLQGGMRRIDEAAAEVERLAAALDDLAEGWLSAAFDLLSPHAIARASGSLPHYIRGRRGREALSRFRAGERRLRAWIGERMVRLLYQRSEAVLRARRRERRARGADELRALVASLSPRPEVVEALPFSYRNLFLGKPAFTREFWVGWEAERRRAESAVAAHRRGLRGGVLLVGEAGAGKTAFAQLVATQHFPAGPVHTIVPPPGGSIEVAELDARLRAALGAPDDDADPLAALPSGSALVFDDVDLWWERSERGFAVLSRLLELVDRHGDRCFFLLTMDVHAFRFVNRVHEIEGSFLGVIECGPFSARQIEEILTFRHGLTGMAFTLDGRPEAELSAWRRARLFSRFFDYARGNVGVALQAWIAQLREVSAEQVAVAAPAAPRLRALDALRPMQTLLLVAFVLHRALTPERLPRVTGLPAPALQRELGALLRAGLVVERGPGVLMLDPFLRPHLVRRFCEEEVIA